MGPNILVAGIIESTCFGLVFRVSFLVLSMTLICREVEFKVAEYGLVLQRRLT